MTMNRYFPEKEAAFWCDPVFISLGEAMLRFTPLYGRLHSSELFHAAAAGSELNVTKAMTSTFGRKSFLITSITDNVIGRLLLAKIRSSGILTDFVTMTPGRIPLYFAEEQLQHQQVALHFDREGSACSLLRKEAWDWKEIFTKSDCRIFHTSAIFCGLGKKTLAIQLNALEAAKKKGCLTSFDLNYRHHIWQEKESNAFAAAIKQLLPLTDILFASASTLGLLLGKIRTNPDNIENTIKETKNIFPDLKLIMATDRKIHPDNRQSLEPFVMVENTIHSISEPGPIVQVRDRIGSGDALAAATLAGLLDNVSPQDLLRQAQAAALLAMTSSGDSLESSKEEIIAFARGNYRDLQR